MKKKQKTKKLKGVLVLSSEAFFQECIKPLCNRCYLLKEINSLFTETMQNATSILNRLQSKQFSYSGSLTQRAQGLDMAPQPIRIICRPVMQTEQFQAVLGLLVETFLSFFERCFLFLVQHKKQQGFTAILLIIHSTKGRSVFSTKASGVVSFSQNMNTGYSQRLLFEIAVTLFVLQLHLLVERKFCGL